MTAHVSSIKPIQVDGVEFRPAIGSRGPEIQGDGCSYSHWHELSQAFPFLCQADYVGSLAILANFLARETQCEVILNPRGFQEAYQKALDQAKGSLDLSRTYPSDYGHFDCSSISPPEMQEQNLIFFAKELRRGLPYKVHCPLIAGEPAHYSLLPRVTKN